MRIKVTYLSYTFTATKIKAGTIGLEQSLPILSLGIDTYEVEVKCSDESILNFTQNSPIRFFHRDSQIGIGYVQNIRWVGPESYVISAISTLGLLEQKDYYGGIFAGQTLEEVVTSICGNIPVIIKTNLLPIKLYGWLPISKGRAALQQVLFAAGANLITDANGVLRIENLWDGLSAVIPADRIYRDGASVTQDNPVTSLTVLEHQYTPGTAEKNLFEGTTIQEQRIKFDEPCDNLHSTGFQILESGANYAVVSAGSGKLVGTPYVHTTIEITRPVTSAPIVNDERIENATLVSLVNSNAVTNRMVAYYKCRKILNASVVLQREHPGQVVRIYHPYSKKYVTGSIFENTANISGVLKGDIKILADFFPEQVDTVITYDQQEVISQPQDFVVPEGVSHMRIVLLDGGAGGQAGYDGKAGSRGGSATIASPNTGTNVGTNGKGGEGGDAGAPGLAGKVRILDLDVQPGQVIHVQPGSGGEGGASNGMLGEVGTKTVVTIDGVEYNTDEDGDIPPNGYYDVTTGITYAKSGVLGQSGTAGTDGDRSSSTEKSSRTIKEWSKPTQEPISTGREQISLLENSAFDVYPNYERSGYFTSLTGTAKHIGYNATAPATTGEGYYRSTGQSAGIAPGPGSVDSYPYDTFVSTQTWTKVRVYMAGSTPNTAQKGLTVMSCRTTSKKQIAYIYRGVAASGDNGVTIKAPDDASVFGCGGDGGNGGGGGYGGAAGYVTVRGTNIGDLTYSETAFGDPGGAGLPGTKGADGAPGAAILYYGVSKVIKPGPLMTAEKSFRLDKTGHLIIG